MKSKTLYFIIFAAISFILIGCGNVYQTDFSYKKEGKKITIVLENNAEFLVVGKPTKARFDTENINNKKLTIVGAGIRTNHMIKDGFRFTITPIEEMLEDGKMKIIITESIENDEKFSHTFFIPVKLQ